MFVAYDLITDEILGQAIAFSGDTVVILTATGHFATDVNSVRIVKF
jgi:hypothetical protein